jgi:hypothetical protein
MHRRHAEYWTIALLPLLVMRLLLPTGVMPAYGTHGVGLVLCSLAHLQQLPAKGSERLPSNQRGAHSDPLCPFATAAAPAPIVTLNSSPEPPDTRFNLSSGSRDTQRTTIFGPHRSQLTRAPPSYS